MKIGIVMTYYDREKQLLNTLQTIEQSNHRDHFVTIVDDSGDLILDTEGYKFPIYVIHTENKTWFNPEPAYNIGISLAISKNPDAIIIQNAECRHEGDIISYVSKNIDDEKYIPFACFSLDKHHTFEKDINLREIALSVQRAATHDGDLAWYNHPLYRNCQLDFCSAISTKNMISLNGYDERFIYGWGYGDDFLKLRIKRLGLEFFTPEYPFVYHQWHYNTHSVVDNRAQLIQKNRDLYNSLSEGTDYRATHIITPDL